MKLLRLELKGLFESWLAVLLAIPLLSYFGRSLQREVRELIAVDLLAWLIALLLLIMAIAVVVWLVKQQGRWAVLHLTWLVALILSLPWLFPLVEERLHFVFFGLLGFLSLRLFGWRLGSLICLAVSGLD